MPKAQAVTASLAGQMAPDDYTRLTLRMCLEKRKEQLPATREAVDYAEECDAQAELLEAAIAADDQPGVRAVLDWTKATHERFSALRGR